MENHIAKHFALQLGSLASLYLSVAFFIVLVFGMVNLIFPDGIESVWQIQNNAEMVRVGFAMTVVFFPTYLWLTRIVNRNRRTTTNGSYLGLTKWLIYLSLLVGGAVLLGDLVAVIMGFLNGDLTNRFLLKALAVLVVAGSAVYYYLKDAQGYWVQHEKKSMVYGGVASLVIFGTLATSLAYIETPAEVRERKIDEQQVEDLREIQWAIEDYLRVNETLPEGIMQAYDSATRVPQAPEGRSAYTYELTETGFSLCATFETSTPEDDLYYPYYAREDMAPHLTNPDDWYFEAGEWCFERDVKF